MDLGWTRIGAYALCRDDQGRLLLTRFDFPSHPDHGKWTMPGGGMEWGESPRETAHRELLEETGLTATVGDVAGVYSRWFTAEESAQRDSGHFVGILFHASEFDGRLRTLFGDLDTTSGAEWFPIDEIDALPHVELVDFALEVARRAT
jgi:8-oxo-dGTP diphosphatase